MENKIKEIIEAKGLTQKELASMTGMSEMGISKAIKGSATRQTLKKIADALDVDVDDLVEMEDIPVAKYDSGKTPLMLGKIEMPCYVLDDGRRVFSGRGIQKAIGSGNSSGQWLSTFINKGPLAQDFQLDKITESSRIINEILDKQEKLLDDIYEVDIYSKEKGGEDE